MNTTPNSQPEAHTEPHAGSNPESQAPTHGLASVRLPSANARRAFAQQFTKAGLAPVVAQAAATLVLPGDPSRTEDYKPHTDFDTRSNRSGDQITVIPRVHALLPLIEPNHLSLGRLQHQGTRPVDFDPETRCLTITWTHPDEHAESIKSAYDYYTAHHSALPEISAYGHIETWYGSPLLVPIRHQYADGTATQITWLAADGTARIFGMRNLLASALECVGLHDHPWHDPAGVWTVNATETRRALATFRNALATWTRSRSEAHDTAQARSGFEAMIHSNAHSGYVDLAGLASTKPEAQTIDTEIDFFSVNTDSTPDRILVGLNHWIYGDHSTPQTTPEDVFPTEVLQWARSLSVTGSMDADDIEGTLGCDLTTREGREELAAIEENIIDGSILSLTTNKHLVAKHLALAAVAIHQTSDDTLLGLDGMGSLVESLTGAPSAGAALRARIYARLTQHLTQRSRGHGFMDFGPIANMLRTALLDPTTMPDTHLLDCDLYGVNGDLDYLLLDPDEPTGNPQSSWYRLTAFVALTYAALHGHLEQALTTTPITYPAKDAIKAREAAQEADYEANLIAQGLDPDASGAWDDYNLSLDGPQTPEEHAQDLLAYLNPHTPTLAVLDEATATTPPHIRMLPLVEWIATEQGHRAVIGYAHHANRGTLPENLLIKPHRTMRIGGQ